MATTIIKVKSAKVDKLSENIEKSLKYLGKAMQCVESLSYNEDDDYYNEREHDEDDDYEMGERYNMRRSGGRPRKMNRSRYGEY